MKTMAQKKEKKKRRLGQIAFVVVRGEVERREPSSSPSPSPWQLLGLPLLPPPLPTMGAMRLTPKTPSSLHSKETQSRLTSTRPRRSGLEQRAWPFFATISFPPFFRAERAFRN